MTGVAELDKFISVARRTWRIFFKELWLLLRLRSFRRGQQRNTDNLTKFVVLCWRRTGSNWLCGILHNHPDIFMHNEIFNETSIHTYYPNVLGKWSFSSRDLNPQLFLDEMLSIKSTVDINTKKFQAVGFKSFPEHYWDGTNPNSLLEHTFLTFMEDRSMKKVILHRKNVFAVYISMVRSRKTGGYLTTNYDNLKININIQELQSFIDRYSFCYRQYTELSRWQSAFYIEYEDLLGPGYDNIIKELTKFLGVTVEVPLPLPETVPQSSGDISDAILNYEEIEFAWRHTSLSEFLLPIKIKDNVVHSEELSLIHI